MGSDPPVFQIFALVVSCICSCKQFQLNDFRFWHCAVGNNPHMFNNFLKTEELLRVHIFLCSFQSVLPPEFLSGRISLCQT